ncbi:uncharacterized protein M8220_003905 [Acridotheres tristis]
MRKSDERESTSNLQRPRQDSGGGRAVRELIYSTPAPGDFWGDINPCPTPRLTDDCETLTALRRGVAVESTFASGESRPRYTAWRPSLHKELECGTTKRNMGRSPTSDYDYVHSRKGPGNRQLDTLHPNQESPVTMGSPTFNRHKTGVQGKALIAMLMLSIARIGDAFVKVTVPEPTVIVPQEANINLTCLFSDDQGAGFNEVKARWKLITTNEVFSKGIVTIWDMKQQKGNTTLMISHLQKAQVGQFSCIV